MLLYYSIAFMITFFIGYLIETYRMRHMLHLLKVAKPEIIRIVTKHVQASDKLDMFTMNDIRTTVIEKFIKLKKLDEFKVYKIDRRHVGVYMKKGQAEEEINLVITNLGITVDSDEVSYNEDVDLTNINI